MAEEQTLRNMEERIARLEAAIIRGTATGGTPTSPGSFPVPGGVVVEASQYYAWVYQDHSPIPGPVVGSFGKSWTFYAGDREAAGIGAA